MVSGPVFRPFHVLRVLGWDARVCAHYVQGFLGVGEDWSDCSVQVLKGEIIGPVDGR